MAKLAEDVFASRAARNAAKSTFDGRMSSLKGDLEERGLAARIADDVTQEARTALDSAMDVAGESKGIIAGTIAVLVIWFLRNPILAGLQNMLASEDDLQRDDRDDHE